MAVYNGLNMTQEIRDVLAPENTAIYKLPAIMILLSYKAIYELWVLSCIFRI